MNSLFESQARDLVENYLIGEETNTPTQDILDSGTIPRLKGYVVKPGKVSDSIFGGFGSYIDKSTGLTIAFENPSLVNKKGVPIRIMVRSPRISTHDINRGSIPFKDQILALNHHHMLNLLQPYLGNSQFSVDGFEDTSVVIAAENLQSLQFENVLRAYMAKSSTETSLFQHYLRGERYFCGHKLPESLIVNGKLPYVMDTPSTKSDEHDESVSPLTLFESDICSRRNYKEIINNSLVAFGVVSNYLRNRGLIAVDTKTEHGINSKGNIVVQDEVWTLDSSRFWLLDDYQRQMELLENDEIEEINPKSFSKEFARGFSVGEKKYTNEQRIEIAVRYIIGIQHLLGRKFVPNMKGRNEQVIYGLEKVVEQLVT